MASLGQIEFQPDSPSHEKLQLLTVWDQAERASEEDEGQPQLTRGRAERADRVYTGGGGETPVGTR